VIKRAQVIPPLQFRLPIFALKGLARILNEFGVENDTSIPADTISFTYTEVIGNKMAYSEAFAIHF
jgi:hypothetical protein